MGVGGKGVEGLLNPERHCVPPISPLPLIRAQVNFQKAPERDEQASPSAREGSQQDCGVQGDFTVRLGWSSHGLGQEGWAFTPVPTPGTRRGCGPGGKTQRGTQLRVAVTTLRTGGGGGGGMSLLLEGGSRSPTARLPDHHAPYSLSSPLLLAASPLVSALTLEPSTTSQSLMDGDLHPSSFQRSLQALMDGTKIKPRVLCEAQVQLTSTTPLFEPPKHNSVGAH